MLDKIKFYFNKVNSKLTKIDRLTIISYLSFIIISLILVNIKTFAPNFVSSELMLLIFMFLLGAMFLIFSFWFLTVSYSLLKIIAIFFLFCYILCMFVVQVFLISILRITNWSGLILILVAYLAILIICLIKIYHYLGYDILDKLYVIGFGLLSYFSIILELSFFLFIYYGYKNYIDKSYIYAFEHLTNIQDFFRILFSTSIERIFNYPNEKLSNSLSYTLPYFAGKIVDAFLLAYIFSRVTATKPRSNECVNSKFTDGAISIIRASYETQINKLRNENERLKGKLAKKK